MRWECETSYGRTTRSFGQVRPIVKWKVRGWHVHIWCDESNPVSRTDSGVQKAIAKVLDALCPGRGKGFGCELWERGVAEDAPDSIRVYYRVLHVRMYNGELVGIDLGRAKEESQGVLNGGSDGHVV